MIAELIDPAVLGIILVGVMLFAIFVGFPISFTLIFLGFVFGYLGFGKLVFYLMTLQFSMVMTEQTLAAVPLFVFMGIYWLLEVSPSSPPNNVSLLHLQSVGFFIHWFDSKNWDHPAVTFFQHLNQVPPNHSPLRRHISTYRCSADWSDDPGRICLKEEEQGTGRWRRK